MQEACAAERQAEEQRARAEQRRAALAARLAGVQESCARLERSVAALQSAAVELRATLGREREVARARIQELERALQRAGRSEQEESEHEVQRREEMAGALAAAVERLRARVAAVGDEPPAGPTQTPADAPAAEGSPAAPSPAAEVPASDASMAAPADVPAVPPAPAEFVPRLLAAPARRESWLAPAIRRVAERRDARLAGELIAELLPAQRVVIGGPLSYRLRIAELDGPLLVRMGDGAATVQRPAAGGPAPGATPGRSAAQDVDFLLEGRAADFAELAAGGARRRLRGVRLRGARRPARSLRRARRQPLALWDLAAAGVDVWPGLLLLALAEGIDPRWTTGQRFTAAFSIEGPALTASATVYVGVRDGEPLAVTRAPGEQPAVIARLSERAFTCMVAGTPLPAGERILVEGDRGALERLIGWIDRAQGLSR